MIDPRRTSSARWADLSVGLDVGADSALANAIAHEILAAGLENRRFIEHANSGFQEYRASVARYAPERAETECGVPAEVIRRIAHD